MRLSALTGAAVMSCVSCWTQGQGVAADPVLAVLDSHAELAAVAKRPEHEVQIRYTRITRDAEGDGMETHSLEPVRFVPLLGGTES